MLWMVAGETTQRLILVAEDDLAIARLYQMLFAEDRVVIAESANETIRRFHEERPDLLILDFGLRESTAEDVVRDIGGDLPLTVVVSADPRSTAFAATIGAPLVHKPFDVDYLTEVIERATAARAQREPSNCVN